MRGLLSFKILWFLSQKPMYGQEIAKGIEGMIGGKPSPGTLYPALKRMEQEGWIRVQKKNKEKIYTITESGKKSLRTSMEMFYRSYKCMFEVETKKR